MYGGKRVIDKQLVGRLFLFSGYMIIALVYVLIFMQRDVLNINKFVTDSVPFRSSVLVRLFRICLRHRVSRLSDLLSLSVLMLFSVAVGMAVFLVFGTQPVSEAALDSWLS